MNGARTPRAALASRAPRILQLVAGITAMGATAALLTVGPPAGPSAPEAAPPAAGHGRVVDETGRPVAGAVVTVGPRRVRTDGAGWFTVPAQRPALGTVTAPGHTSRTLALSPAGVGDVELSRRSGTVVLRFGGDVMFGRRFYERHAGRPPLITDSSSVAQHAAVLSGIAPLLRDADLTVVNLETPLTADPYWPSTSPRPRTIHPTKALAFASATASAQALAQSGVDVVSLGNNHSFDALGAGLRSTGAALDGAGIAHFGAGANSDEAWRPAYVTRNGQRLAFLGCTTVSGRAQAIPYVAGPARAGAAECSTARLRDAVRAARRTASSVIVLIHGAVEYQRTQTDGIRALMSTAAAAGAAAVVTSHPHVIGGVRLERGTVVAESTGNLLFDQDLWSTFPSYLLRVDLRQGRSVHTSVDPLALVDYQPVATIGPLAEASARIASGTVPSTARLTGWGATMGSGWSAGAAPTRAVTMRPHLVRRIGRGWVLQSVRPAVTDSAPPRAGVDLLYGTGTFEELDVDRKNGAAPMWTLGLNARVSATAACGPAPSTDDSDGHGLALERSPLSTQEVFASPAHRAMVRPGETLTLGAQLRRATDGAAIELRWYRRATGRSVRSSQVALPHGSWPREACQAVHARVIVPAGMNAVQVFVRVRPSHDTQLGKGLALDELTLLATPRPAAGAGYEAIDTGDGGTAVLRQDMDTGDGPLLTD